MVTRLPSELRLGCHKEMLSPLSSLHSLVALERISSDITVIGCMDDITVITPKTLIPRVLKVLGANHNDGYVLNPIQTKIALMGEYGEDDDPISDDITLTNLSTEARGAHQLQSG